MKLISNLSKYFYYGKNSDSYRSKTCSLVHINNYLNRNFIIIIINIGSNKGIGFSIVKGLAEKFNGIVYLTGLLHLIQFLFSNLILFI